jgi:hypothetical protein
MHFLVFVALLISQAHAQQWMHIEPGGDVPVPRGNPAAIYDPVAHRLVAFGGRVPGGELNDVWAFDLNEHTWSELVASDPLPNLRYGTAAIFDPRANELVNFAGFTDAGRFDPNSALWNELSVASNPG